MCCSPWGRKELDTTEQFNTTRDKYPLSLVRARSFLFVLLIYFFIFGRVLHAVHRLPLVTAGRGYPLVVLSRLLIAEASLVAEHRFPQLCFSGPRVRVSGAVAQHGLSSPEACGIFPDQGSNQCPLHSKAECQPLDHQGSPL